MSGRPRTVLVAYGDRMLAESIAGALARFPGIVPVGFVTTAQDAAHQGGNLDAVALDGSLPGAPGAARQLRKAGVRVVMVVDAALDAEEGLWVSPSAPLEHLAVALVPDGGGPGVLRPPLTLRQREILSLIERGLAGKQVARQLGISEKTVERHKTRIFARLGVPNQTAAVSLALRRELAGG